MSKKFLTGIDLANQKAINLADGSNPTDAVTKQQLDAAVRGLDWKASVRAASTANVSLAAPGTTLDGVTLASGDRILLLAQTTGSQNGIYVWTGSAAALTRATDADASAEVTGGMAVTVTEGTVNADKVFVLTTNDPITLDTTSLAFSQLGGGGSTYTNGNGIALAGNVFSILLDSSPGLLLSGTGLKVDPAYAALAKRYAIDVPSGSTTATITHNLGSTDVIVAIYDKAAKAEVECDVVTTDSNTVTLTFAVAPTSGQYRAVVLA
jgi:hypothetical protein